MDQGDHCKVIKPVDPKGSQPWVFLGSSDAEAEVPILCLRNWATTQTAHRRKESASHSQYDSQSYSFNFSFFFFFCFRNGVPKVKY